MFIKRVTKFYGEKSYTYVHIVESYREKGIVKQRPIAYLGRIGQKDVDSLIKGLNRLKEKPYTLEMLNLTHEDVLSYGDVFLVNSMWKMLGIPEIIKNLLKGCKVEFDVAKVALLLVANRCIEPASKLAVWEWQKKLWIPEIKEEVDYHKILRALGYLEKIKDGMERALYNHQINLFTQKVDLVFYDITSSYFEGRGPEIAKKGYSSDKRHDCNQILLALALTKEGIPIGHEVYEGNKPHFETVIDLVNKLNKRFEIDKCILIADRGMVSPDNINEIRSSGYDYIFGLRRRRLNEIKEIIEPDFNKYHKIRGIAKGELYYIEVKKDGTRYVVCHNPSIAEKDRENLSARKHEKEEKIRSILKKYRDPGVIVKHIAKIPDVDRYFKYRLKGKEVVYEENQESLEYENLIAGKWVLKTENFSLSTIEVISAYKNLFEVEQAFRTIKSFLDLRPMYHRDDERVRGHVFICVLAYYLQKVMGKLLSKAGLELSGLQAIEKLSEIKLVKSRVNDKKVLQAVTLRKGHTEILKALGIPHIPLTYLS